MPRKTKTEQYIDDAVAATRKDSKRQEHNIRNVSIDSGMKVDIHADEAISVLEILARAALENNFTIRLLGEAVADTITGNDIENNSIGIRIEGDDK